MSKTKILTEGAVILALYIVLLLITMYVPLLGSITMFMLPIPFVVFAARRELKSSIFLLIAALILTILFGSVFTLPTTLLFGSTGVVIGFLYKLNKPRFEVLSFGSITVIVNLLILYAIMTTFMDISPIEEGKRAMQESMDMMESMMVGMGQTMTAEQWKQISHMMELGILLIPAVIIFVGIFFAFVTQLIAAPILKRLGLQIDKWPPFRDLQLPKSLLWYYLIAMVLMLVPLDQDSIWFLAIFNLFNILQVFMVLQGFSFLYYFGYQKNISKGIVTVVVILSLLLPFLLYLVRIIGIIDLGFNLRKRVEKK
ncbi:YybS family protein [Bacillus salitolerans]|uniref:YybS family protein n=1 Tax=Bacillus salitolerans TaxID=1437434 RepID=A0ABW4LKN0_9BACI